MYLSKMFLPTLKEAPADAKIASYALMVRAGLMRKIASGLYAYLPLGMRVMRKVENIVREEMNMIDSQECEMPLLLPKELLMPAGRWDVFKDLLFRLKDRHEVDHALGPTHEEAFTEIIKGSVYSYREFPLSVYQIHTKFRDELRPRFGVIRSREFLMKDAYTYHLTDECLDKSYKDMSIAYSRCFIRMGIDTVCVKADSGAMGGEGSEEFMVLSNVGEEEIIFCDSCGYKSNVEKATVQRDKKPDTYTDKPYQELHTPNIITIADLEKFFNIPANILIKTLIYTTEKGEAIAVLIRGDLELNEVKLSNHLGGLEIALSDEATIRELTGARVGFAGPIGMKKKVRIIADYSIQSIHSSGVGGNKDDTHITSVNIERDFKVDEWGDFRRSKAGDACPHCGKTMYSKRGLELGHIFKLGKKYSAAFNLNILDENNKPVTLTMGCYGIGINRSAAAVIEQQHDENGIIFPISVAPYEVIIVPIEEHGTESFKLAEEVYDELAAAGIEVLLDDRDERVGVKLNCADLIGIPMRIVIGDKDLKASTVSFKLRRDKEGSDIKRSEIISYVVNTKKKLFDEINGNLKGYVHRPELSKKGRW